MLILSAGVPTQMEKAADSKRWRTHADGEGLMLILGAGVPTQEKA
jgi:hypothetical protein